MRGAVEALVREHNTTNMTEGRMFRKIMREIRPYISSYDLLILLFIFDRTYVYGKVSEVIPMKHFLEGVRMGSGEILHPRVPGSRRSVYRALENLIANVIIIASKSHRTATPSYAINPIWTPYLCHQRHKLVSPVAQTSVMGETYNNIDNNIREYEQVAPAQARDANGEEEMQTPKERAEEVIALATSRTRAAREKKKTKLSATGLEKIWEDAFREAYPDDTYFRWKVYEQSAFKKAMQRGVPDGMAREFIEYIVSSFANVINTHFAWMKSKPVVPQVGFVTKHIDKFYAAFEEDRDPNRRLRRRIRETQPEETDEEPADEAPNNIRALEEENRKLRAALSSKQGKVRRSRIRKIIKGASKSSDPEFGSWD